MVKHVVFWRLKPEAHGHTAAQNAQLIKEKLEALVGVIPGLLSVEVGFDLARFEQASDVALYATFDSREALAAYDVHPAHKAVVPFITDARAERWAVDYDV